jgi:hypothetical protein
VSDINDSFDPDDYEGVQPRMAQLPRAEVRRFEKDRKERDALKAQMAAYERQLVFAKAGIDADEQAHKWFVNGYDGELTVDAIKAAAIAARLIGEPGSPVTSAEQQGHEIMQRAAAGTTSPGEEDTVAGQLNDVARNIGWRDADKAQAEIMRIVNANDIKYHLPGLTPG